MARLVRWRRKTAKVTMQLFVMPLNLLRRFDSAALVNTPCHA